MANPPDQPFYLMLVKNIQITIVPESHQVICDWIFAWHFLEYGLNLSIKVEFKFAFTVNIISAHFIILNRLVFQLAKFSMVENMEIIPYVIESRNALPYSNHR